MTKNEFYKKLQAIYNNRVRQEVIDAVKSIKVHNMLRIYKAPVESIKSNRKLLQELFNKAITYKQASNIYEFLMYKNIPYDFIDNSIVLHYPEIVMDNGHKIYDIYIKFNPVAMYGILDLDLEACRTTFTYQEYIKGYCHPHIAFSIQDKDFHDMICMGSTQFTICDFSDETFVSFLLYLDVFLRHEFDANPYKSTSSLYIPDLNNRFNTNFGVIRRINWANHELEYAMVDNLPMVAPVITEELAEEYSSISGQNAFVYNNGEFQTSKIQEIDEFEFKFSFQNQPVKLKILNIYENAEKTINPNWERQFRRFCAYYLTSAMETFNNSITASDRPSDVLMQEYS
jgi:hypothetical protein